MRNLLTTKELLGQACIGKQISCKLSRINIKAIYYSNPQARHWVVCIDDKQIIQQIIGIRKKQGSKIRK